MPRCKKWCKYSGLDAKVGTGNHAPIPGWKRVSPWPLIMSSPKAAMIQDYLVQCLHYLWPQGHECLHLDMTDGASGHAHRFLSPLPVDARSLIFITASRIRVSQPPLIVPHHSSCIHVRAKVSFIGPLYLSKCRQE